MRHKSVKNNSKNRATVSIWGAAVGLFALCIPLSAATSSGPILPILVMLCATVGTVAVWLAPEQHRREDILAVKALEDRIANLETICTSLPEVNRGEKILEYKLVNQLSRDGQQQQRPGRDR